MGARPCTGTPRDPREVRVFQEGELRGVISDLSTSKYYSTMQARTDTPKRVILPAVS